jgi:hypothetical protein
MRSTRRRKSITSRLFRHIQRFFLRDLSLFCVEIVGEDLDEAKKDEDHG